MEWRMHGANPDKLYEQFHLKMPEKVIDYSNNANVIEYDKPLDLNFLDLFEEYPDDEVIRLRELVGKTEQLPIDNIFFCNGTNEAIYIIASYYENKTAAILHPTYSEYAKALEAYHAKPEYIFDFNEIKDDYAAFIICNPNNPTGRFYDDEVMEKLAKNLQERNIDLIVDEAYIDFMSQKHQTLDVRKYKNVYILRSLTKFYHVSGIRIGYVLASDEKIQLLKRRQPTWSVNSIAQEATYRYMTDEAFIKKTKKYYEDERARLFKALRDLGFEVVPSPVNFFIMKVEQDEDLIRFLLTKGIVIRHTRNFPTLEGNYVRITIKTPEEDDYLINALKEYKNR